MPSATEQCPLGVHLLQCITPSDIAESSSTYFISDTTIHFLPGTYTPNQSMWIIANQQSMIHNLSLIGDKYRETVIECSTAKVALAFVTITELKISNVVMKRCGLRWYSHILRSYTYNSNLLSAQAALFLSNIANLYMENVQLVENTGYGLLAFKTTGNTVIYKCNFKFNNWGTNDTQTPGGNAYFVYPREARFAWDCTRPQYSSKLTVLDSSFSRGRSQLLAGAGLTLEFMDCGTDVNVNITNSYFFNNVALKGANLYITMKQEKRLTYGSDTWNGISINNCGFYGGIAMDNGGGLYIEGKFSMHFPRQVSSSVSGNPLHTHITNTNFSHNHAKRGGGLGLHFRILLYRNKPDDLNSYHKIPITVDLESCSFTYNDGDIGAAVYTQVEIETRLYGKSFVHTHENKQPTTNMLVLQAVHTDFHHNLAKAIGGAIHMYGIHGHLYVTDGIACIFPQYIYLFDLNLLVDFCTLHNNTASRGSAISIMSESENIIYLNWTAAVIHSDFIQNKGLLIPSYITPSTGVIHLEVIRAFVLTNCSFTENEQSGLYLNMSAVSIQGYVSFTNNTATIGAAMFLDCTLGVSRNTLVFLQDKALLYIANNRALEYGGGIAIKEGCNTILLQHTKLKRCFFDVQHLKSHSDTNFLQTVIMKNNTAEIAGDTIYGGDLEVCNLRKDSQLRVQQFWALFNIDNRNSSSAIASQALKVCICTSDFVYGYNCPSTLHIDVYPGQPFDVTAIGVGQYNYGSPSVIRAEVNVPPSNTASLGERQTSQDVRTECKNLTYTIHTRAMKAEISLRIEAPLTSFSTPFAEPAIVNAVIQECPFGFEVVSSEYDSTLLRCDCAPHLLKQGVTCRLDSHVQAIQCKQSMWIGNFSGDIVVHHNCPLDYCKQEVLDISPYNQQEQCNFDRTGVLCGACRPGLSHVLGTSQCLKCPNTYLLLLPLFALAGVLLVVMLLKCNFTVSTGTINGLIFYVNIIQVNHPIFFPAKGVTFLSYMLSIFIAWANLDLGIEVCLFDGLNAYIRTWLQFVFPVYIWMLVGIMILVSRYSFKFSKLIGSNIVQVLATLFLFSYAKLLRTTLNAFSTTMLTDRNGTATAVWLLDGNYTFLRWPHIILFITALFTLLAHLLPIMLLILLAPFLQKYTHGKIHGLVTKFKPLLDAYQGPYKTKYRYWTGLMLLFRLFLFSLFAGNALGDPRVNLLTITLTVLFLLLLWVLVEGVYRTARQNKLEQFFLINLGISSAASHYIKTNEGSTDNAAKHQAILSCLMVGSVFVVFLCILSHHCYTVLIKIKPIKPFLTHVKEHIMRHKAEQLTEEHREDRVSQAPSISIELREPLLTSHT